MFVPLDGNITCWLRTSCHFCSQHKHNLQWQVFVSPLLQGLFGGCLGAWGSWREGVSCLEDDGIHPCCRAIPGSPIPGAQFSLATYLFLQMELSAKVQDLKQGNDATLVEEGLRDHNLIHSASTSISPVKLLGTLGDPKSTPSRVQTLSQTARVQTLAPPPI